MARLIIPSAPQLHFMDLFRALLNIFNTQGLNWPSLKHPITLFPHGTDGIMALVKNYKNQASKDTLTLFLPAYYCNNAVERLYTLNTRIIFYPLNKDLTPNWKVLDILAHKYKIDIFTLVHYFGFANDINSAKTFCNNHQCLFLEDGAHIIQPSGAIGLHSDVLFLCLYKSLALPTGALFHYRNTSLRQQPPFKRTPLIDVRWLSKKIILRLLAWTHRKWPASLPPTHADSGEAIHFNPDKTQTALSQFTYQLILSNQQQLTTIANQRAANYQAFSNFITGLNNKKISLLVKNPPKDTVPFALPILVDTQHVETIYQGLLNAGIPVQAWPDLPEYVKNHPTDFITANDLRNQLLLLPIHQSIGNWHNDYIKKTFLELL